MNTTTQPHRFVEPQGERPFQRGDHRDVDLAVAELQAWCREVGELGCPRINELGARLRTLRDVAVRHFAEEEEGGYMAGVLEQDPDRAYDVSALLLQHAQFLNRFELLIEGLCAAEPCFDRWTDAVHEVRQLLDDLKAHEQGEMRLLRGSSGAGPGQRAAPRN